MIHIDDIIPIMVGNLSRKEFKSNHNISGIIVNITEMIGKIRARRPLIQQSWNLFAKRKFDVKNKMSSIK